MLSLILGLRRTSVRQLLQNAIGGLDRPGADWSARGLQNPIIKSCSNNSSSRCRTDLMRPLLTILNLSHSSYSGMDAAAWLRAGLKSEAGTLKDRHGLRCSCSSLFSRPSRHLSNMYRTDSNAAPLSQGKISASIANSPARAVRANTRAALGEGRVGDRPLKFLGSAAI